MEAGVFTAHDELARLGSLVQGFQRTGAAVRFILRWLTEEVGYHGFEVMGLLGPENG